MHRTLVGVVALWTIAFVALAAEGPARRLQPLPSAQVPAAKVAKLHNLQDLRRTYAQPVRPVQLPLLFESNMGQAAPGFQFVVRSVGFAAGLSPSGLTAVVLSRPFGDDSDPNTVNGHAIQLSFRGAARPVVTGEGRLKAEVNVIRGANTASQVHKVPVFTSVAYRGLYRGVDMVVAGANGRLNYGFVLQPNADISTIRVAVRGVKRLKIDADGNLLMRTPRGTITQVKPRFMEGETPNSRVLTGRYLLHGGNEYGFQVSGRTPHKRLIIDPEIVFTTYFGGGQNEGTLEVDNGASDLHGQGFDVAIGPESNAFVVGTTASPDFPVTAAGALTVSTNAFVVRIDPQLPPGNQVRYATFIGGSGFERGVAIAPRQDGSAYVTGCTTSSDFPTSTGVLQPTRARSVGYIVRLTPSGDFDIGTLIGRDIVHHPASIAYEQRSGEPEGFVYLAGSVERPAAATSTEFGSSGFQTQFGGGNNDGFIAKLDAALTHFEYFTLLGGSGRDFIRDLAVNDGFAFVTGATASVNFPTSGIAHQAAHSQAASGIDCANDTANRGCFDAFVTRLARDGSTLIYSTLFGGDDEEFGRGIAVSVTNQATVTGGVKPLTGDDAQIFAARFEGGGENVLWDTRLLGRGRDHGEEVVVDVLGRAHVVGTVSRDGLSTSEATFHGGASDIFYARFAADNGELEYFTYIGGSGEDRGFAVAAQGSSANNFCAFAVGSTTSNDVTTVNPLTPGGEQNQGRADILMTALCDIPPRIDLPSGFQKTVAPTSVTAGGTVTYTISVQNGGDAPAGVTVTDTVPASLTITGVTGAGCGRTGNTVTCAFNAAPGPSSISITARTGAQCPNTITNTARIQVGNRTADSSASFQVTCPPPLCGNGRLDPGEQCDPGENASCRSNCTLRVCGDGIVDTGEACDRGAENSATGRCSLQCRRQVPEFDECSRGGPVCAGELVCGKRCGVAKCVGGHELFGFCLFGTDEVLCSTPAQCMAPNEADITISQ